MSKCYHRTARPCASWAHNAVPMNFTSLAPTLITLLSLAACGGGGGGGANSAPPVPTVETQAAPKTIAQASPLAVKATSFLNEQAAGQVGALPDSLKFAPRALARADFMQRGVIDLIVLQSTYSPQHDTAETAKTKLSTITYYRSEGGTYVRDTSILEQTAGCVDPSNVAVADFNGDTIPDVFVACSGYDAAPFPGERNMVILSNKATGKFNVRQVDSAVGFHHDVSAADINGDGKVDAVVAAASSMRAFLGNGDGTFTESMTSLPGVLQGKMYYTVELVDVDNDSRIDLLAGGHEWGTGRADTLFIRGLDNMPVVLPSSTGNGVVLDFLPVEAGGRRLLYVVRTAGGPTDGDQFYGTRVIQRIDLNSNVGCIVFKEISSLALHGLLATPDGVQSDYRDLPGGVKHDASCI